MAGVRLSDAESPSRAAPQAMATTRCFYVREAGCTCGRVSDIKLSKLGSRAKAGRLLAPALRELLGSRGGAFSG